MESPTPALNVALLPSLEGLPENFAEMALWFKARGWALGLTSKTYLGVDGLKVTVERDNWLGRFINSYEVSIISEDRSEHAIINASHRLAAVTTGLSNTFTAHFPYRGVNREGIIETDKELTDAYYRCGDDLRAWFDFLALQREQWKSERPVIHFEHGLLHFNWHCRPQYLDHAAIISIKEHLDAQ